MRTHYLEGTNEDALLRRHKLGNIIYEALMRTQYLGGSNEDALFRRN